MDADTLQFYPTPAALAEKMLLTFTADPTAYTARVLEPSAGDGAIVRALVALEDAKTERLRLKVASPAWMPSAPKVNCDFIEIDISRHATLESIKGVAGGVVGLDFLDFRGSLAQYTHICMNPPFQAGVQHLLRAWRDLFDGEIVCLLNAESIHNPVSKERQYLNRLIEQYGEVEFIQEAFTAEAGAERVTGVEVALVHLTKKCDVDTTFLAGIFDGLEEDTQYSGADEPLGLGALGNELALPMDTVDRAVLAFESAHRYRREAVIAGIRSEHAARLLGQTLARLNAGTNEWAYDLKKEIRKQLHEGYVDLKDRAWASVLRSVDVQARVSAKVSSQLENEFSRITRLDFSRRNVLGFLCGLVEGTPEMDLQSALDVFDEITRYHSENACYYLGWKSNDRHYVAGRSIRATRFILPYFSNSYGGCLDFSRIRRLRDFDKVFALLDGKPVTQTRGLATLFEEPDTVVALKNGQRISSDYFDIRWYPGRGTIHFFPRRKDLVDRLNRLVGKHRQWLPDHDASAGQDFWTVYAQAEKTVDFIEKAVAKLSSIRLHSVLGDLGSYDLDTAAQAGHVVAELVLASALHRNLDPLGAVLSNGAPEQGPGPHPELLMLSAVA